MHRHASFVRSAVRSATQHPWTKALYRRLPLTSRQIGPPRCESPNADYARAHGAKIFELDDAEYPQRPGPVYVGRGQDVFLSRVSPYLPENSVVIARRARMIGPHGWIVGDGDTFLSDASWYRGDTAGCGIYDLTRVRPRRRIAGRSISLASDWASTNYVHFLLDALPRIALLEAAGLALSDADHVVVPDLSSRTGQDILDAAGIPQSKRVPLSQLGTAEFDELVFTSYPGIRRNISRRQTSFIRQRLAPRPRTHGRRVYVSRGDRARRRIVNEAEILRALERAGFEVCTPGQGIDDLRTLGEASIVVGAHGAGLANAAACGPGSALLEILPDGHLYPYFYTLATSIGCHYACIVGEPGQQNARTDPFRVDAAHFERLLERVIGEMEMPTAAETNR